VTDHQHYWEDGGATYHNRYSTYEFVRGQEGDLWKGVVQSPKPYENQHLPDSNMLRQDSINRTYLSGEEMMPQARTFELGLEFIQTNHQSDNWFLQLETFDPHEPFFTQAHWKEYYPHEYAGPPLDWPPYARVTQSPETVNHIRYEYAALMTMCDHYLGKVLDAMDTYQLWDDTMLIVNTDHGFLLGEHDWWAKSRMPWYNELAHIPLFIWDPRSKIAGERRQSLVQTIDLPATILEFFDIARPPDMQGVPLGETIAHDQSVRKYALFGIFGGHVNITDGRYVYMRATHDPSVPIYNYTLMPTHMRTRFSIPELQSITLSEPFSFSKNCPLMKIGGIPIPTIADFHTLLFDLENDPEQRNPLHDPQIDAQMTAQLVAVMQATDAPVEQFERLGLQEYRKDHP
jgi:arylsulfatase A-like enzyme